MWGFFYEEKWNEGVHSHHFYAGYTVSILRIRDKKWGETKPGMAAWIPALRKQKQADLFELKASPFSEFWASHGCKVRPSLKNRTEDKQNKSKGKAELIFLPWPFKN